MAELQQSSSANSSTLPLATRESSRCHSPQQSHSLAPRSCCSVPKHGSNSKGEGVMLYKACRFLALRFSEISARQAQGILPASFGKAIRKRTRHAHSADRRRRIIGTSVGRVTSGLAWPSQDNASDRLQANHMTGVTKTFASSSFKRATAVRELTCYITQAAQQLLQWLLLYCIWTFLPHVSRRLLPVSCHIWKDIRSKQANSRFGNKQWCFRCRSVNK